MSNWLKGDREPLRGTLHQTTMNIMRPVPGTSAQRLGMTFLGVVLLASCGGTSGALTPGSPTRGVPSSGSVTLSGHLYVVGGPAPGLPRPIPGTVVAQRPGGSYAVTVGSDGEYTMQLPPGTYTVTGTSWRYNGGSGDCPPSNAVTVVRDQARTADVYCHMR